MPNNAILFNAALAGAFGALQTNRNIQSAVSAVYNTQAVDALALATLIDADIPTDASVTQQNAEILQSLCEQVISGKGSVGVNATTAAAIAAAYLAASALLVSTNVDGNQANWYIDETNGNDSNSGATPATALKTTNALNRRFSGLTLNQSTTVQALTNLSQPFNINNVTVADGFVLTVQGAVTVIGTATISNVVAIGAGTTQPWTVTTTGIDWTTIAPVGLVTSGPRIVTNTNKVFWLVEVIDANNIVVGVGYTLTGLGTLASPVIAETLSVQTLSTVPASQFRLACQTSDVNATIPVVVKDFAFVDGAFNMMTAGVGKIAFTGNDIQLPSASSTLNDGIIGRSQWIGNKFTVAGGTNQNFIGSNGNSFMVGPTVVAGANATIQFNGVRNLNNSFFQKVGIFIAGRTQTVGTLYIRQYTAGDALAVLSGSAFITAGAVGGAGNTGGVGINVSSNASLNYQVKPTLTSTTADTKIGGANTAYAAIPVVTAANNASMVVLV